MPRNLYSSPSLSITSHEYDSRIQECLKSKLYEVIFIENDASHMHGGGKLLQS
jgi:hypothetical protein